MARQQSVNYHVAMVFNSSLETLHRELGVDTPRYTIGREEVDPSELRGAVPRDSTDELVLYKVEAVWGVVALHYTDHIRLIEGVDSTPKA
jgi:hypothetical protein